LAELQFFVGNLRMIYFNGLGPRVWAGCCGFGFFFSVLG